MNSFNEKLDFKNILESDLPLEAKVNVLFDILKKYGEDVLVESDGQFIEVLLDEVRIGHFEEICPEELSKEYMESNIKDIEDMINDNLWYVDKNEIPMTFKEWEDDWDNRDLEGDSSTYITPKGEKIHIFCQFGYDG